MYEVELIDIHGSIHVIHAMGIDQISSDISYTNVLYYRSQARSEGNKFFGRKTYYFLLSSSDNEKTMR